jgi:hypothetical protein
MPRRLTMTAKTDIENMAGSNAVIVESTALLRNNYETQKKDNILYNEI